MTEINDFTYINGFKIEIKTILRNSNLEPIIFLHEGLGSVSLWKDFPLKVSEATNSCLLYTSPSPRD